MKNKLAVAFCALVGVGLAAAPSASFAQGVKEVFKAARQKKDAPPAAAPAQEAKAKDVRSVLKKGKGKGYAKGQAKK